MKISLTYFLALAVAIAGTSCQKQNSGHFGDNDKLNDVNLNSISVTCPPTVLSGTYTSPLVLSTGNSYLLRGNVVISNTSITIPAGVVIYGESATNGALVILPNATINATGTSTNPIVFTSDKAPGTRAAGDWAGVYLLGQAPNNQSNALSILINGASYTAGGSTAASSVGTFKYAQIHYAGGGGGAGSDRKSESSFVMASLGSASDIEYVQVSESARDGIALFGGTVFPKHVMANKIRRTDFMVSYGFQGKGQYLAGVKSNATVNTTNASAYAMDISNVLLSESQTATPLTNGIFSNASFLGWAFCGVSVPNADAIVYQRNGNSSIYNSVISSFSQDALFLNGNNVIAHTSGSPELQFAYNSFHNIGSSPGYRDFKTIPWSGCSTDMTNWIEGLTSFGCEEQGNQFTVTTLGLPTGDVCVSCPNFPDFSLKTNTLQDPEFDLWDTGNAFDHPVYRGAFGSTAWFTNGWADTCPLSVDYCL